MSTSPTPYQPDQNDLDRMHAAVKREKQDLQAKNDPAPMIVIFLGILVAVIAGSQLGANTGSYDFETSNPYAFQAGADPRPGGGGAGAALDPFQTAMKKGANAYATCGGCHQGSGMGIAGQYPPLAGSEWVLGGTERLVRVVQHGLIGEIQVKGQTYNFAGGMQPFGAAMSAQDLANVLTYIRNSWGNEATMVTKEMVEQIRKTEKRDKQWTMPELAPFADKNVPGEIPAGPGATAPTTAAVK
jgi:mono/diheme cytochrome c family protein